MYTVQNEHKYNLTRVPCNIIAWNVGSFPQNLELQSSKLWVANRIQLRMVFGLYETQTYSYEWSWLILSLVMIKMAKEEIPQFQSPHPQPFQK